MAAFERRAWVAGYPCAVVEEFNRLAGHPDIELLLDQGVGDRVIVPFDLDMVVDIHPSFFPLGVFIGQRWQGTQCWTVERLKETVAGPRELFERTGVEVA
jgi:hypothetical protein